MIPSTVTVQIGNVVRDLEVREVSPGVHIGVLLLAGDAWLTEKAGRELSVLIPADVDIIVMPDGKAQALLHVVQREIGLETVLLRKECKSYLQKPVTEVAAKSITSGRLHHFFLGADDVERLRGKTVLFLDDVISSGGTVSAVETLLQKCGVSKVYKMAVATEGEKRDDVISLIHLEVWFS